MKFEKMVIIKLEGLISSNVELIDALSILIPMYKDKEKNKLLNIRKSLEKGRGLVNSFSYLNDDKSFLAMINIVEKTGDMKTILSILKEKYYFEEELKKEIISISIYPLFVSLISFIIVVAMLVFLVPQFKEIYVDISKLPFLTRFILYLSDCLYTKFYYLLFFIFLLYLIGLSIKRIYKYNVDKLLFSIPFIRDIYILKFTESIYSILKTNTDFLDAISLSKSDNIYINGCIKVIVYKISKGKSVESSFKESKLFNNEYISFLRIGEKGSNFLEVFLSLKESYRKKLNIETKIMIKVLEPLSILIISIIIAIIVIAMMLPVFQLGDSLL